MVHKRIILTLLVILWMGVIFTFSNQNGEESKKLSDGVTEVIVDKVIEVTKVKVNSEKKVEIIDNSHFLVRKCAHFTIYFILGIFSYFMIKSYGFKSAIIALVICLLYAVSDEIHQLFTLDRSAKALDVLIDFSGSLVSIFILKFLVCKDVHKAS